MKKSDRERLKNECILSFEKPQGKSSAPHPGSGPGPAGRKPDAGVQTRVLTLVTVPPHPASPTQLKQHTEQGENSPQERLNLGPRGQGVANWASGGQEDEEATLWLIPPAQSQTDRGQPTPAEMGQAHFSGTDISDRGGNF